MLKLPDEFPTSRFYYHYKHDPAGPVNNFAYEVISVGFHTEDDPKPGEGSFVNYRPLYKEAAVYQASLKLGVQCIDNRPLKMWMEKNFKKDDEIIPQRFIMINDTAVLAELTKISDEMYGQYK